MFIIDSGSDVANHPNGIDNGGQEDSGVDQQQANDANDFVELCMLNDSIVSRSQLKDYVYRGDELNNYNLLSFVKDTYEGPVDAKDFAPAPVVRRVGRPRNVRSLYKPEHTHSEKLCRVVRPKDHKNLLSIPGSYLPRDDRPETYPFYCASMLALLKPWRRVSDLKSEFSDWPSAFESFKRTASVEVLRVLSNIQYYHECSDAAARRKFTSTDDQDFADQIRPNRRGVGAGNEDDEPDVDVEMENNLGIDDVEELITQLEESQTSLSAKLHGTEAVMIAERSGFFSSSDPTPSSTLPRDPSHRSILRLAEGPDFVNLLNWKAQMAEMKAPSRDVAPGLRDEGEAVVLSQLGVRSAFAEIRNLENPFAAQADSETPLADTLNFEQRLAYDLIKTHLLSHLDGGDPEQLLMNLQGGPGTGKSQVIKAVTELFQVKDSTNLLLRSAYTGIAASVIDGQTLHTLAKIPVKGGDPSPKAIAEMAGLYENLHYLIIDEISMISKTFFAQLDRIFSRVMDNNERNPRNLPFGGINVIICGDFHQFPPVATKKNAPLYYPKNELQDTEREKIGKDLYDKFDQVVILKQQMRSQDPRWNELLQNARTGNCSEDDLSELRRLILTSPDCLERSDDDHESRNGEW